MGREAIVGIGATSATVHRVGQLRTLVWHQNSSETWLSKSFIQSEGVLYARSWAGSKADRTFPIMGLWFNGMTDNQRTTLMRAQLQSEMGAHRGINLVSPRRPSCG